MRTSNLSPRWPLPLCTAMAIALLAGAAHAAAPDGVGELLHSGALLKTALVGQSATTVTALPGSTSGLTIRAGDAAPVKPGALRKRIDADGQAYAPDARVTITDVQAKRREITVWLGAGGYNPHTLGVTGPSGPSGTEAMLAFRANALRQGLGAWTNDGSGWVLQNANDVNRADRVRELEQAQREATHQRESAEADRLHNQRLALARVSGTQLHIVFARDVTPADLAEANVRALLGPYVRVAEPAAP